MQKEMARRVEAQELARFNVSQRLEHLFLMITFTALVLTGLPQKFHTAPWAQWLVFHFGGIENTRFLHRFFAIVFAIEAVYHVGYIVLSAIRKTLKPTMVPTLQDFRDSLAMLNYCVGAQTKAPKFDRYDYRQKFEYWGIVLGAVIMFLTGMILWWPTFFARYLPGELIPASKEAHGWEAFLAFLVIVVWHLYSVHLSPVHFPMDKVIFTGKLSKEKMLEEHPLEYERIAGPGNPVEDPKQQANTQV
ncbi:MAG: cytochrome C [Chloroflexi bacterium]|nr:cytochrome C [Chloroflexota bacterium]